MDISKIVYGPKFEVSVPDGELSDEGLQEILELVGNSIRTQPDQIMKDLPEDWSWAWKVAHGTYAGTLSKRLQSFVFKKYTDKLSDQVVTAIGNLANQHTLNGRDFIFDFDNTLDWHAGDYGDKGSCFWGEKVYVLPTFRHFGGFAMRIYLKQERTEEYKGVGRALIYPYLKVGHGYQPQRWTEPDALLVFNGYGKEAANYGMSNSGQHYGQMQMLDYARLLAMFLGVSYQRARLSINGSTRDPLYVNNEGSVTVVGPVDEIKPWKVKGPVGHKIYHVFDVKWPQDEMNRFIRPCVNCGKIGIGDGVQIAGLRKLVLGPDGRLYCEDCLNKIFVPCYGGCGTRLNSKENRYQVIAHSLNHVAGATNRGYMYYCDVCRPKFSFKCPMCADTHFLADRVDYHVANGGRQPRRSYLCANCALNTAHIINCPECTRPYPAAQLMQPIETPKGVIQKLVFGSCPQCRHRAKRKAAGQKDDDDGVLLYLPLEDRAPLPRAEALYDKLWDVFLKVQAVPVPENPIEVPITEEVLAKLDNNARYIDRNGWRPSHLRPFYQMTLPRGTWELNADYLLAPFQKLLDDREGVGVMRLKNVALGPYDPISRLANFFFFTDDPWAGLGHDAIIEALHWLRREAVLGVSIDPEFNRETSYSSGELGPEADVTVIRDVINQALPLFNLDWPPVVSVNHDWESHIVTINFN